MPELTLSPTGRTGDCSTVGEGTLTLNGVLLDQNFAQDNGGAIANANGGEVHLDGSSLSRDDRRIIGTDIPTGTRGVTIAWRSTTEG